MVTLVINIWKYRVISKYDCHSRTLWLRICHNAAKTPDRAAHFSLWAMIIRVRRKCYKTFMPYLYAFIGVMEPGIRPKLTADLKLQLVPTLTMSSGDFGSSHSKSPWNFGTDTERGLLGAILGANRVSTVRVMRFILCKSKNNPIKIYTVHSRQWLVFWASKTHHGIEG